MNIFSKYSLPRILEKNLESQQKIAEKLQQLINLRQRIDINYEYDSANPDETLVLIDNYSERPDAGNEKFI